MHTERERVRLTKDTRKGERGKKEEDGEEESENGEKEGRGTVENAIKQQQQQKLSKKGEKKERENPKGLREEERKRAYQPPFCWRGSLEKRERGKQKKKRRLDRQLCKVRLVELLVPFDLLLMRRSVFVVVVVLFFVVVCVCVYLF